MSAEEGRAQPDPAEPVGDPACWLAQVCTGCGRLIENPYVDVCPNCGADRPETREP